jgi:hypothetical protein
MRRRINECRASGLPEAINWRIITPIHCGENERADSSLRALKSVRNADERKKTLWSRNDKLGSVGCSEPGFIRTTFRAAGEGYAKREVTSFRRALVILTIGLEAAGPGD